MKVRRVGFVGTRTPNVEATTSFFRDVLGLEVLRNDPAYAGFGWFFLRAPDGNVYAIQQTPG